METKILEKVNDYIKTRQIRLDEITGTELSEFALYDSDLLINITPLSDDEDRYWIQADYYSKTLKKTIIISDDVPLDYTSTGKLAQTIALLEKEAQDTENLLKKAIK